MSNLWINVDDLYNQLSNDDQFETYVLMIDVYKRQNHGSFNVYYLFTS